MPQRVSFRAMDEANKAELAATLRKWAEEIESFDGVVTCQDAQAIHEFPISYANQEDRSGRMTYTITVGYLPRGSLGAMD